MSVRRILCIGVVVSGTVTPSFAFGTPTAASTKPPATKTEFSSPKPPRTP